jgi:nicotinamidase-related amidase
MSRSARAQEGFLSTLMRERARARRRARSQPRSGDPVPRTASPTSALLVMDVQNSIVERFADDGAVVDRAAAAVAAARAAGVPVIFVRVAFRPGFPEVSPRNKTFAALRDGGGFADDEATAIHPAVAPEPGEVVVTKRRVGAFSGSDLDVVLRAGAVEELVLCGIATSGVVLSTLRAAADLDYGLTVLRDACADGDPEVHRVLLDKVFPRQARVVDVADWAASLTAPVSAPPGSPSSRAQPAR